MEETIFEAAAGGGGRGMRRCDSEEDVRREFQLVKNEAKKAFGNKGKFNEILRKWIPEEEEEFVISEVAQKLFSDFDNRANAFMNMFVGGKTDA